MCARIKNMKIAIHVSDLDHERIDGTRVYIKSVLNEFAKQDGQDEFWLFHQREFNPALEPDKAKNFVVRKKPFAWFWTQTRFAWELFKLQPQVLWMPVHNLPCWRRQNLRTVVTIHDLAFKLFPNHFPPRDLRKLNLLADHAITRASKLIAISEATKQDILKFYPEVSAEKIAVVHHGFDAKLFEGPVPQHVAEEILAEYGLANEEYLLYVGAIQPRKNLEVLVTAFEKLKIKYPQLKLVLAGARAWHWESTVARIAASPFASDIVETGKIPFGHQPALYQNARVFVFPSLYEGFGIPVLEAFASGVPVVAADNSSLPEVGGEAALFFTAENEQELANCVEQLLKDETLRTDLALRGKKQLEKFSWDKCARQTLAILKDVRS